MTTAGTVVLLTTLAAAVGAAWSVVRKTRLIARLAARIEADALEPRSTFPTVAVVPARHLRTALATGDVRLDWLVAPPAVGELGVTDRELVLVAPGTELLRIPLRRVMDAAFIASLEKWQAGERFCLLKVVWERGGERLATTFGLEASWNAAEKLRRELHFRITMRKAGAAP